MQGATTVCGLALAVWLFGITSAPSRARWLAHAGAGTLLAGGQLLDLGTGLGAMGVVAAGSLLLAWFRVWRGMAWRRTWLLEAALVLGLPVCVPGVGVAVAWLSGRTELLHEEWGWVSVGSPLAFGLIGLLAVLVLLLALDRPPYSSARRAGSLVALLGLFVVGLRLSWLVSMDTLPTEVFWSEAPFLINAMKLASGQPLYGPPAGLSSYTYSPLLDLLHRAALAPFRLELSLAANRALILLDQGVVAVVLATSLGPRLRGTLPGGWSARWAPPLLLTLASFSNLLAPAIHPDHPLLLCFAVALAWAVSEGGWPRWLSRLVLVCVTPLAVGFKLSGAGLGLGLGCILIVERRLRDLPWLVLSGLGCFAVLASFQLTLGDFWFYAVKVQASHPMEWGRALALPSTPAGWLLGFTLFACGAWSRRVPPGRLVRRCLVLSLALGLASLPAYAKLAGRENNLTPLVLALGVVLLLRGAEIVEAGLVHPWLPASSLCLLLVLFRPLAWPFVGEDRLRSLADSDRELSLVKEADATGEPLLILASTNPWIRSGDRRPHEDSFHSAIELYFGGYPEAELFFSHLSGGHYQRVAYPGRLLRPGTDRRGAFVKRVREALAQRYEVESPPGAALDGPGLIVLRRRPEP